MEETLDLLRNLKRHLNSVEHMIYVSCKFTRTSEMLRKVMETIVTGYEQYFAIAYHIFAREEDFALNSVQHKIQFLTENLANKGIQVDMSDYFLLKRLLLSDCDTFGEYRKNLSIVSFVDGQEYVINMSKLLEFFENLKGTCNSLNMLMA
ncbi:MAG: hypothetical protein ACOCXG_03320 [Nanoarchaeota archaeon]